MPYNNFTILSYSIIQLQCCCTVNQTPTCMVHVRHITQFGAHGYTCHAKLGSVFSIVLPRPPRWAWRQLVTPSTGYLNDTLEYQKIFHDQWSGAYLEVLELVTRVQGGHRLRKRRIVPIGEAWWPDQLVKAAQSCIRRHLIIFRMRTDEDTLSTNVPRISKSGRGIIAAGF